MEVIPNEIPEIYGFQPDLGIDSKRNLVYTMHTQGAFTVINGTTNKVIESYYFPSMQEYFPRGMIVNSENGSVSILAPNAAVTIPGINIVPEFPTPVVGSLIAIIGLVAIVTRTYFL